MNDLWTNALELLQGQMPKRTFDQWLKHSTGQQTPDGLTIGLPSNLAIDWVEHRLKNVIERTIYNLTGETLPIQFILARPEPEGRDGELVLTGVYSDLRNEILQPDRVFVATQYFRQAWAPLLGANLAWIIIDLRQRCYWNHKTGEKRNTCEIGYEALAAATGLSRRTVVNLLNPRSEDLKKYLDMFIIDRDTIRAFSQTRGHLVNHSTRWTIRMDDPLTPDDEQKLNTLLSKCKNCT
jgi:chromosomal replication initiation ATPase DnaA